MPTGGRAWAKDQLADVRADMLLASERPFMSELASGRVDPTEAKQLPKVLLSKYGDGMTFKLSNIKGLLATQLEKIFPKFNKLERMFGVADLEEKSQLASDEPAKKKKKKAPDVD